MKKVLLLLFLPLTINAQGIKFETEFIDYGDIALNSDGKRVFKFKNIGDSPLRIKNVRGDLLSSFPRKPIFPNKEGQIEVKTHTDKIGSFSQSVLVYSNAKREQICLKIKGKVIKKEEK